MSTTDDGAAEVAFDPTSPFRTRDGREVRGLHKAPCGWSGCVKHDDTAQARTWLQNGKHAFGDDDVDLTNVDPAPVEPAGDPVRDGGAWPAFKPCAIDYPDSGLTEFVQSDVSIVWDLVRDGIEAGYDMDDRSRLVAVRWPTARVAAAPQLNPDPDLETAITTLLAQVGSSHETHPGAKRDLVRAFVARHGAEARGEVGAGEDNLAFRRKLSALCEPWSFSTGSPPDYESPLNGVFGAGMAYTERLLANALDVKNYEGGDGSEDFDCDATKTLTNILAEAGLWDRDEGCPVAHRGARAPVAGGEPVAWRNDGTVIKAGNVYRFTEDASWAKMWGEKATPLYAHPPAPPAPTAEALTEALRLFVYETTSGCPEEDDGSHKCRITRRCLQQGREALRARNPPEPPHGHQAPPTAPVGGVTEPLLPGLKVALTILATMIRPFSMGASKNPRGIDVYQAVLTRAAKAEGEEAAFAARPTPDDGCPKGDPDCLGGNGAGDDAGSTFAERGAVEAAVAAEREACANIAAGRAQEAAEIARAAGITETMRQYARERQGAYGCVATAIRSRASTPAAIDGLAPGGRDGTEASAPDGRAALDKDWPAKPRQEFGA